MKRAPRVHDHAVTRVGLVLGAGGLTGEAFHRGVLRGLHDAASWDARSAFAIVGTSAGALVAASLRAPNRRGLTSDIPLLPADAHEPPPWRPALRPFVRAVVRPHRVRPGVLATALLPPGRRSTDFITAGLRRRFGATWPEEATYIVAVRQRDGARVCFGCPGEPETDMASAVSASIAIPGYFTPVTIDGETYVDGGVHSPTNADLLAGAPVDLVVVSSPMSIHPRAARAWPDLGARLMWHSHLRAEVRKLRRAGVPVLAIEPEGPMLRTLGLQPLKGARIDEIEEAALELTRERLSGATGRLATALLRQAA